LKDDQSFSLTGYQIERTRAYNNTNSLMTRIKKGMTYFRLHEDINGENLIVIILIIANKQIIIINIYFALEGCRRKKTLSDINLILLKIHSKIKSFNLIITGYFNCNLD
jgi:hypothetical protein